MKVIFFLLFSVLLVACGDGDPYTIRGVAVDAVLDSAREDFVKVITGKSFIVLGTNSESARYTERPKMLVQFSYDFSIGKHEVTYGDFEQYRTDTWGKFGYNVRSDLPITDLTYYDAVLYANARSKAEGYDTAYTYNTMGLDADGHCGKLDGLVFNPDVDAYRLPTEAEWMLVANQGWSTVNAWTSKNSGDRLHDVCTIGENDIGVCDMVGNAMEWVNDWLVSFKDTSLYNFAGGSDAGASALRVVKGGYYTSDPNTITIYGRGDVYPVTSATRAIYVGFRLAFGRIPSASWLNSYGMSSNERLLPKLSGTEMRSLTGNGGDRLIFRNDMTGNLAYIDYGTAAQSVIEIEDTLDCYHPDISPDGKYVAFSTGMEGVNNENSFVYVRHIGPLGDSLVKLDVEGAAIPRWRVFAKFDTSIVYVTNAGDNSNDDTFNGRSTWKVTFKKGKFGTPKKLFDGAYHGGVTQDLSLAVTGSRLLRARIDGSTPLDTIWYNGEQACNVSLANDSSKRTLFLDFGSKTGKDFVGKSYKAHEQLLLADSVGNLMNSIPAPSGYTFDHSEWVNGGYLTNRSAKQYLAVATLANSSGAHSKIVLVNTLDSTVTDLVEGTEIWHPCLWVPVTSMIKDESVLSLDGDSAAIYFESPSDPLLSSKMNLFWGRNNYLKVIALGSSRMSLGFVSNSLTVGNALNMATIPSDMNVSHHIAFDYVFNHCPALKALVIGIDMDLWSDYRDANWKKTVLNIPGYHYDESHDFWKAEGYATMKRLSNMIIKQNSHLKAMDSTMGWVDYEDHYSWNEGHFGYDALVADSAWSDDPATYEEALDDLVDIIEQAASRDIKVLGVIFPQSPYYKKTGSFGRHGMRRSTAEKIIEKLYGMEDSYSNFYMMDENKMGDHDYPDSLAYDYDHLNADGGRLITSRIDSALVKILGE